MAAAKKSTLTLEEKLKKAGVELEDLTPPVTRLSTGIDVLDYAMTRVEHSEKPGLPSGRVIEVYGPESSGKTALALSIIAAAQRVGGFGAYVDIEHGLDHDWARRNGVKYDSNCWAYFQPRYLEHGIDTMEIVADDRAGISAPTVIVFDSVPGGTPKCNSLEEKTAEENRKVAARASLWASFFERGTLNTIRKSNVTIVLLNQTRVNIGAGPYEPKSRTPGGEALRFAMTVRIALRVVRAVDGTSGEEEAQVVEAFIKKCKVAPPHRTVKFVTSYEHGVDNELSLVYYLIDEKVLTMSGSYIKYNGRGFYKSQLATLAKQEPTVLAELRAMARQQFYGVKS